MEVYKPIYSFQQYREYTTPCASYFR